MNTNDAVSTPLDLSCVRQSQSSSRILHLSIRPIDDGTAALDHRPATVGNCSVIQEKPTTGQTAFGETAGYHSAEAAGKALAEVRKDTEKCKGVVE